MGIVIHTHNILIFCFRIRSIIENNYLKDLIIEIHYLFWCIRIDVSLFFVICDFESVPCGQAASVSARYKEFDILKDKCYYHVYPEIILKNIDLNQHCGDQNVASRKIGISPYHA